VNTAPSRPKASTSKDSATMVSSGRIWPPPSLRWPPPSLPSASRHSAWQWKNGAPIAPAEGHGAHPEPGDAGGAKRVAVESGVGAGRRQRRHHISERAERAACKIEHAAAKTLFGKPAPCGFQQRQPRLQGEAKGAGRGLRPLDALGRRPARLGDAAHQLDGLALRSSSPRASSSSRTSRFGILAVT